MKMRGEGYYWVRVNYEHDTGDEIAFWSSTAKAWRVIGAEYSVPDEDLTLLSEQPIPSLVEEHS